MYLESSLSIDQSVTIKQPSCSSFVFFLLPKVPILKEVRIWQRKENTKTNDSNRSYSSGSQTVGHDPFWGQTVGSQGLPKTIGNSTHVRQLTAV